MTRAAFVISVLLCGAAAAAWAGGETVSQRDKQFSPGAITVSRGDTVTFANNDQVVHDITMTKPDGSKTDGVMEKPGDRTTVTLDQAGEYQVMCLIHPMMKMTITVK
jgi:cytochrome c peroxidase